MTDQPTGPVPDRITLTRSSLAVLLAHHADVLATAFRTDASTGLPGYRDGLNRAADLLGLHADHLTAEEETRAVTELLDSMLTCPIEQPAPVDRDALRDRIARAARSVQIRIGRTTRMLVERGEPIILSKEEADEVADAVLAVLPEPTGQATDRAAVLREAAQHLYTALFPAVYSDLGQKAAEGVNRAVSELRRLADETQPTTETETPDETQPESCAHCGNGIRRITGTLAEWWVHIPGGQAFCQPWQPARSTRAEPKRVAGARQDGSRS